MNPPMNSKLRDSLNDIIRLKLSIPLTTETLLQGRVTENLYKIEAEAEKAIRQAVGEEVLGIIGEDEPELVSNTHKNGGIVRNQLRAELRQKIKQWGGLK